MKITASLIAHFSFLIASKVDVDDDVVRALLIASFIAAIRCEEDYRLYIYTDSFRNGYLRVFRLRVR